VESALDYSRYSAGESSTHMFDLSSGKWRFKAARLLVPHLPSSIVTSIGQALYGHIG
jgi:hypothetical protein